MQSVGSVNDQNRPAMPLATSAPVDLERRVLETRIALAKNRLFRDLDSLSTVVKQTAGTAGWGLLRIVLVGGLLVGAIVGLLVRRRRRLRVTWK